MERLTALALGIIAWVAVGVLAVLIVFNLGEKNQVLMFLPIAVAVIAAWGIGEAVTERVFSAPDEGV